ncbi:MAG: NAD(P)H-binding protein [Solirubrobacteraceae bacterium]|nr:NAD(P)H-binding protein [Solirubrobacteraceae bacterium]
MRALITGISGYVGDLLADALPAAGHDVRGFARTPDHVRARVPVVQGDLNTGEGVHEALQDVDVAYYLVHSMEGRTDYVSEELAAAKRFAAEADDAGLRRIVYMSVLTPDKPESEYSTHVRSRLAVEHALASRGAEVVCLRASIVIGADSRSFRFLRHLVERMPVLPLPPWRHHRTSPIDERDLVRALVAAATAPVDQRLSIWDAVGPDVVTYQELISAIADHLLVGRPVLPFPLTVNALTAPVAAAIAGEDLGLVEPLIQSLGSDLLARPDAPREIDLPTPRHHLTAAIEHALRNGDTTSDKD